MIAQRLLTGMQYFSSSLIDDLFAVPIAKPYTLHHHFPDRK